MFQEADGGYMIPSRLYGIVKRAGEAIGRSVHPHMLRHTFASTATEQAVPPRVVQRWMGHSSYSTTERYAHLRPTTEQKFIERLPSVGGEENP